MLADCGLPSGKGSREDSQTEYDSFHLPSSCLIPIVTKKENASNKSLKDLCFKAQDQLTVLSSLELLILQFCKIVEVKRGI